MPSGWSYRSSWPGSLSEVKEAGKPNEQEIERTVLMDALQRRWRGGGHVVADPFVTVRAGVSSGIAGRAGLPTPARPDQASRRKTLSARAVYASPVPLGPSVPVYALRRFT